MTAVQSGRQSQLNSRKSWRSSHSSIYIIEEHPCQHTNIAAKIVGPSLRKRFASRKPTNFPPAHTVTAPALEKSYPPLLFHLERDRPHPPAPPGAVAPPAADFPEEDNFNGRAPFSLNYT